MTQFKIISLHSQTPIKFRTISEFMEAFETEVQKALNKGWKIINCQKDRYELYAFLQKD